MPESSVHYVKRDGVITFSDLGGVNSYTVAYEPGDLSLDVPDTGVNNYLDRGRIGAVPSLRLSDDAPITGSFTVYMRDIAGADYATLLDIAHRYAGGYVATNWVSTLANSDVVTFDMSVTYSGTDVGKADQGFILPYVVLRASVSEGDPNTISCSFTSYAVKPVPF